MLDKASFRVLSRFKAVKRIEGGFHVVGKYQGKKKLPSGNTVYLYSEAQVAARNRKKAKRLEKLTKSIKSLRAQVKRDLKSNDPEKALTALAVGLMDETAERVGSDASADGDLNEDGEPHFGVTTWTRKHITFGKGGATIKYTGKSGVKHVKKIQDAGLVKALKKAYDACEKGDDNCIFSGEKAIKAKHVNAYLKTFNITAKDIRGLHANDGMREALKAVRSKGGKLPTDKKEREKKLKAEWKKALAEVAEDIGHEPATLSGQYLVPGLEDSYIKDGTVIDKLTKTATVIVQREPTEKATDSTGDWYERPSGRISTKYAYHGAPAERGLEIKKRGLVPGSTSIFQDSYSRDQGTSKFDDGEHLFFADTEQGVRAYGELLLRFPWPADAEPDQSKSGKNITGHFVTLREVRPTRIEFKTEGTWRPIKEYEPEDEDEDYFVWKTATVIVQREPTEKATDSTGDWYERPLDREGAVKAPPGWTPQFGGAGRPFWTSPDGKVEITDGLGRPGMQRYQVIYLEGGRRLEALGWPSFQQALASVEGRLKDSEHPLFRDKEQARIIDATEWAETFFHRHTSLRKYATLKVLDKASGGTGPHGEARQHGNEVWLFPKFWKLNFETRDFVFAHEIGHFALSAYGLQKAIGVAQDLGVDPWDSSSLPFGQFNMDEAFADCFASYHLDRSDLKSKAPAWVPIVEALLGKKTVTAATVTLDGPWVDKMRKDFLTLLKNVPRVKNYTEARTLSKALHTYGERFNELFFVQFLNKSLKYEETSLSDQDRSYIDQKLRKVGWSFYIELGPPIQHADAYYSEEARFAQWEQEKDRWANRLKSKARAFWTDMSETIQWYERIRMKWKDDPEKIQVKTPDIDQLTLSGFRVRIQGYDPSVSYMPSALEQVKWALEDYRQKAKQRLPILLQKQLPLIIDFEGGLSTGGSYHGQYIWLNATSAIGSKDTATTMTKTLAHEMGHHIFKSVLSKEATELWYALIRGDYGDLDLRELLQKWPSSVTWAMDFSESIRESDPILSLQVATVSEGYQPGGFAGRGLDKREDFQAMLDKGETKLRVPQTPITGYAGKNSEEAFCETVGLLVAYGPRAVHEKIRSWLDVVLPGQVKLAQVEAYER